MPPGACRISRRCCTTRRSSCSRTSKAAQASGDPFYLEVAEDTLLYVLREMTDLDGGFYCAEDADSIAAGRAAAGDGKPHKSRRGVLSVASGRSRRAARRRRAADQAALRDRGRRQRAVRSAAGIHRQEPPVHRAIGRRAGGRVGRSARRTSWTRSIAARVAMFQHRLQRPRPDRDDKILTAWNGLMIARVRAHGARAARVRARSGRGWRRRIVKAARRAAAFLRERMWSADARRLLRRYRKGDADIDAYAEDYACLIFGLLELFQADPDPKWLEWAIALQHRQDELFWDEAGAGWFSTTGRDPSVLLRMKEEYDGAEPTASSLSVMNLLMLSHLVDDEPAVGPSGPSASSGRCGAFGERLEQLGRGVPMMAAALVHVCRRRAADRRHRRAGRTGAAEAAGAARSRAGTTRSGAGICRSRFSSASPRATAPAGRSLPFVAAMAPVDGKTIGVRVPRSDLPGAGDGGGRTRRSAGIMKIPVDVWLRGTDFAKTAESLTAPPRPPAEWTDEDVQLGARGRCCARWIARSVRTATSERSRCGD